jgi:XRE family transcriptional regulator, regulator of sulfur utilization
MQRVVTALAKRIRDLRKKRGFSQEAFADHAGLHRVAVGWIEQGRRVPSLKTLVKVSHGLGISLSELFRGVDKDTRKHSRKSRGD